MINKIVKLMGFRKEPLRLCTKEVLSAELKANSYLLDGFEPSPLIDLYTNNLREAKEKQASFPSAANRGRVTRFKNKLRKLLEEENTKILGVSRRVIDKLKDKGCTVTKAGLVWNGHLINAPLVAWALGHSVLQLYTLK